MRGCHYCRIENWHGLFPQPKRIVGLMNQSIHRANSSSIHPYPRYLSQHKQIEKGAYLDQDQHHQYISHHQQIINMFIKKSSSPT